MPAEGIVPSSDENSRPNGKFSSLFGKYGDRLRKAHELFRNEPISNGPAAAVDEAEPTPVPVPAPPPLPPTLPLTPSVRPAKTAKPAQPLAPTNGAATTPTTASSFQSLSLSLSDGDLADLRRSGLTDETIRANEIHTLKGSAGPDAVRDAERIASMLRCGNTASVADFGCMVFPYHDLNGQQTRFIRARSHVPRRDSKGKEIKYEQPRGSSPRAYYPVTCLDALRGESHSGQPLFITEGEKKALALAQLGLPAIGIGGVYGWTHQQSNDLIPDLMAFPWHGRPVYLIFDWDAKPETQQYVTQAAQRLAAALRKVGVQVVRRVQLPPGPEGAKQGVDDFLVGSQGKATNGHGAGALQALIGNAEVLQGEMQIVVINRESRIVDQSILVMNSDSTIFHRCGILVHVVGTEKDEAVRSHYRREGSPQIVPVGFGYLRERLSIGADFVHWNETARKLVSIRPPGWVVEDIFDREDWSGVRDLVGIVNVPTLRPDGTLLVTPGYDLDTGLLYLPSKRCSIPVIPDEPTLGEILSARDTLFNLVADFPFKEPIHRSAFLAYLLTLFSRYAFHGPVPLIMIDSNVRGAGKGLLASLGAILLRGADMSVMTSHADDAEMRKSITSIALRGDPLAVIDNVEGSLGGASLDSVLTSDSWQDRLLGTNKEIETSIHTVWVATGNNMILRGDTSRRVLRIRLNSPEEYPEDRSGFHHADLKTYALNHRSELVGAILTILRGYCIAGQPLDKTQVWGSFSHWSRLVCGAVVWLGEPDPGLTRKEVRKSSDTDKAAIADLFAGMRYLDPLNQGLDAGEIVERSERKNNPTIKKLHKAICHICKSRDGKVHSRSFAQRLHSLLEQNVGGKKLENIEPTSHRVNILWIVVDVPPTPPPLPPLPPSKPS